MLSISCKSAKHVPAIHVDIPEWDSSSMASRYIQEQQIFPVAGNIAWAEGNIYTGAGYIIWDRKYFL